MFKKLLAILAVVTVFLGLAIASAMANESFNTPTELQYYDPAQAYNGITMFSHFYQLDPKKPGVTYMIDMDGRLLHKFKTNWGMLYCTIPLDNGNFLRWRTDGPTLKNAIEEVNWFGTVVWSFIPEDHGLADMHHEARKIFNKKLNAFTYIFLSHFVHTAAEAQAVGAKGPYKDFSPDGITEVDRQGNIVWQWQYFDHLCQNFDATKANYVADVSTKPGRLDVNATYFAVGATSVPKSGGLLPDMTHSNSVDYNQDTGLILINSRAFNEFWVMDHDKTFVSTTNWAANIAAAAGPDGDFVYRFGCPSSYNQGAIPGWATNGNQQLNGAHNVQWIRKNEWPQNNWNTKNKGPALPGAGDLLVYNNGGTNASTLGEASRLYEINPFVSGPAVKGVYPTSPNFVNPPQAGYISVGCPWMMQGGPQNLSNQIIWRFEPQDGCSFSSPLISSVQRLPNGNTFADSGSKGHLVEVTPSGQIVWDYIIPIMQPQIITKYMQDSGAGGGTSVWRTYRSTRWSVSHPAFKNHLVQYSDGTIQPIIHNEPGVGFTLTGAVPCRRIPCQYIGSP